jgi:hypothetical protein
MTKLYDKVFHGALCCICYQPAHHSTFDHSFAHEGCFNKCNQEFQDYLSKQEHIQIDYKIKQVA